MFLTVDSITEKNIMTFTEEDRQALYAVWMTRKVRLHLTQMEMAKRLGLTQTEFSAVLRGPALLEMTFVESFVPA